MSIKQMSKVWEWSEAEGNCRLVLLALADHADDDGFCFPGITRVAKKCRVSTRTVQRCVRELEDRGELKCSIGAGALVEGHGHTNRYEITINPAGRQNGTSDRGDKSGETGATNRANRGDTVTAGEPSVEPSGKPPGGGGGGKAKAKGHPTEPESKWCAKLFSRKLTTQWTVAEVKAYKAVKDEMTPEVMAIVEAYYRHEREKVDGIHRRDLPVFLNNFLGEVDRAIAWQKRNPKLAARNAAVDQAQASGDTTEAIMKTPEFAEWLYSTYEKSPSDISIHLKGELVREYKETLR